MGFKDSFIHYSETMGIRAGIVSEWELFFEKFYLLVCPMGFGPAYERCKIGTPMNYDGKKTPLSKLCLALCGMF
jgi:amidase